MNDYRDSNPLYFRFLKGLQLVMSIICLTLRRLYPIKIYYLIIIFLTIIGTGFYIISFSKLWSNAVNTSIDIFYFALWFSSGLANLDPIYNGSSNCKQYVDHDYDLYGNGYDLYGNSYDLYGNSYDLYGNLYNYQPPWIRTACRVFIVGLAFAFLNASLFLITLFLSLRLHKDHSESLDYEPAVLNHEPAVGEPNTEVVNRNRNNRWII
ncbi:hypothetical protein Glove_140g124 [Diversispora epigaea]|uniref:MARVEL domain-containing protein n=1 Tax=Diversispora epigaea TaxID=1348612 RepID=A0A397IYW3_9GLOM|nr:hypothetical protein Glove_140g124 [Diversispora epigaea]